jgi:hypothetical protein
MGRNLAVNFYSTNESESVGIGTDDEGVYEKAGGFRAAG